PESCGIAGVDHLLGSSGIEMNGGFDAQDQRSPAALSEFKRALEVAHDDDRVVGTGRETQTAPGARLVDDPDSLAFDGHGVSRAHAHASVACHALIRSDSEIHKTPVRNWRYRKGARKTCD